ncbi:MAG: hypothetical protein ACMUIP_01815 [bacterium]
MMIRRLLLSAVILVFCLSFSVNAAMVPFYFHEVDGEPALYTAEGAGISIDAVGIEGETPGIVEAFIPEGAVIDYAFLYSASRYEHVLCDVIFENITLTSNEASRLDVVGGDRDAEEGFSENRWDVTSIVRDTVGEAYGSFYFSIEEIMCPTSLNPNRPNYRDTLDGEILVVLYHVSGEECNTVFIYDGELNVEGDSFDINLANPFAEGDEMIMSLGISFGNQGIGLTTSQYSEVDINGVRLTSSAGGQDDQDPAFSQTYGGFITAGGIGDSPDNPPDPEGGPNAGTGDVPGLDPPFYDDELYDLAPFLEEGDEIISLSTRNPSLDDNIFFMALTASGMCSSAAANKEDALVILESLSDLPCYYQKWLAHAITEVKKSLGNRHPEGDNKIVWLDPMHVACEHGHQVFIREKKAVHKLEQIRAKITDDTSTMSAILEAIDLLVQADRLLALTAIKEAPDGKDKQKAIDAFIKGETQIRNEKKINEYKKAWKYVNKCCKKYCCKKKLCKKDCHKKDCCKKDCCKKDCCKKDCYKKDCCKKNCDKKETKKSCIEMITVKSPEGNEISAIGDDIGHPNTLFTDCEYQVEIHTSCSKCLYEGQIIDGWEILEIDDDGTLAEKCDKEDYYKKDCVKKDCSKKGCNKKETKKR